MAFAVPKKEEIDMRVLQATAKVLGLSVGETFESDSEFYDPFIKTKFLVVVDEEEETVEEPVAADVVDPAPAEEPATVEEPAVVDDEPVAPTPAPRAAAKRKSR